MDFSKYELTDEIKAQIEKDYAEDIAGLKAKNSDLIERAKASKEELEQSQIDYAKAEEEAKIALAEKEGDIGKYKIAVEESNERIQSLEIEFKEKEKARLLESSVNEFVSGSVKNDPAAKKYMEGIYRDHIDVIDGEVKPKDITKSLQDLRGSLVSDESYSNYVKADVGSGAGSAGSNSGGGTAKTLKEMTATEEAVFANSNPAQYAQMINN